MRDRVVVVTGGGSGIGGALCRGFAAEGAAAIVVADIDRQAAEAVAAEVGGMPVVTDVAMEPAVRALVQMTLDVHGRIDVYCSNAGIAMGGGPEAPDEAWQRKLGLSLIHI